jgi:hypothetical protein
MLNKLFISFPGCFFIPSTHRLASGVFIQSSSSLVGVPKTLNIIFSCSISHKAKTQLMLLQNTFERENIFPPIFPASSPPLKKNNK